MSENPARQPDGAGEYLRGGPGEPTLLISDHVSDREQRYRQQLREVQDGEIKDLLAKIEKAETVRRTTPPPRVGQLKAAVAAMQARRENEQFQAQADALELPLLEAWATANTPPPSPPAPTRFGKPLSPAELAHERTLDAQFRARNHAAAKAVCTSCRVVGGDCGRHG